MPAHEGRDGENDSWRCATHAVVDLWNMDWHYADRPMKEGSGSGRH
jgi:hypothetical protein